MGACAGGGDGGYAGDAGDAGDDMAAWEAGREARRVRACMMRMHGCV